MMVTTHVAMGLLLAVPIAVVTPAYAAVAAVGAIIGGILPDIDLFVGQHRRSLHYPTYYSVGAVIMAGVAMGVGDPVVVAAAVALGAAGLHSITDWLGAGDELRPWERTSPRGVYLHVRRRWLRPRYLIRYDGAPEDLMLTVVCAAPAMVVYDGQIRAVIAVGLVIAMLYTLVRKRLPDLLGI
ncbi:UNVERIFIED_CONTAM: hypothetical protein BEN50_17155 [Euhalothece sp. KZN 001]|jgi:hypothetical protein